MPPSSITFRSSIYWTALLCLIGSSLVAAAVAIMLSRSSAAHGWLLQSLFLVYAGIIFAAQGLSYWLKVEVNVGKLTLKTVRRQQSMDLEQLASARLIHVRTPWDNLPRQGRGGSEALLLTDRDGQNLCFIPNNLQPADLLVLMDILKPYVFNIAVDKNFQDLPFSTAPEPQYQRMSFIHILRGSLLYVLLPSLLLSIILMAALYFSGVMSR